MFLPTRKSITISIIILLLNQTTTLVSSKCTCDDNSNDNNNVSEALKYKLIAMTTTLVASIIGVCLPIMAKNYRYLNPENDFYFLVKSFAAGVILATGFIHILHDAFENLTNPCIGEKPWGLFPFSGFVAMLAAIGTLIMEALLTGYHKRSELMKAQPLEDEDEEVHHHHHGAGGGNVLNPALPSSNRLDSPEDSPDHLRNSIVSQILELAIVAHSIIVGVSLGVSQSPNTIKPLVAALSFHQCFEGMGLGACISQAQFKNYTVVIMVLFFCFTIPTGIGVGIGISKIYNEGSPKALIVEGILLSASAGILIYMALVDLLASDFMNPKMLRSLRLQLAAILALLVGVICMSLLVLWEGP
ncbi:hypothetical protein HN51_009076 [Arachis hypogaea]|uniref:zinc transporter 1 n=2 Tax=Arachis TaxID=3817 RepID=A0A6P4DN20_ARADU|nr:zinc transporter 1 isoform X1 [Arachis duranensis]XP_025701512.1 zinc transporter 1 [Arachis hypogaea]QHO43503.1 Zinc transporter [Arachis hypogaea]QHO43504.1 Zinc transporter [Arachis hypogaea]RYR56813.1 hypothetical protein Ahy_A05g022523 [Arachis hypogaea]